MGEWESKGDSPLHPHSSTPPHLVSTMLHATLKNFALQTLRRLDQADLVIGISTHPRQSKIAVHAAQQAILGARRYFPHLRTALINADVGINPQTRQALQKLASPNLPVVTSRYNGVLGKGAAVSAILHGALLLRPQAIVILDGQAKSIAPEWVPALSSFVLNKQSDLVKPRYHWPLPDGGLSDLLFYPFIRALWGTSLRHPAAAEYALSPALAQALLQQDVWQTEINRYGFDVWLSTFAVTQNWRVAQAALGSKETVNAQSTSALRTAFKDAVGVMLRQVSLRRTLWPGKTPVKSTPTLSEFAPPVKTVFAPNKDCVEYIEGLALGWIEYRALWKRIILPEHLLAIEYLTSRPNEQFYFPSDLWAKIAYDFAVVYNKGERDPDAIALSLYPLYLGRLASFWGEIAGLSNVGRAGTVAAQAVEFEEHLPYLEYRWENYLPWIDSGEKR